MIVVIYCCIIVLLQHMAVNQFMNGLKGKVRVDCTCTVTKQGCKVMYFSWLSGFQDNGKGCTLFRLYQMLMNCGYCQK